MPLSRTACRRTWRGASTTRSGTAAIFRGDDAFLAAVEHGVRVALARRDDLVLELCRAAGIPVAVVMSGGYARDVNDTVDIHFLTIRAASARCASSARRRTDEAPFPSMESA